MLNQLSLPLLPIDGRELLAAVREGSEDELGLAEEYIYAAQSAMFDQVQRAAHYTQFELILPCFPSNGVTDSFGDGYGGYTNSFEVPFTDASFAAGSIAGIELRVLPFLKVTSVQYYDTDNALQTLTEDTDFIVVSGGLNRPATLYAAPGKIWPNTKARPDAVSIKFWAGEVTQVEYAAVSGSPFTGTDGLQTVDGYEFLATNPLTFSHSGNSNSALGPVACGVGTTNRKTYYVAAASGDTFTVSATSGGAEITLDSPTAATVYAGTLSPLVKRVLMTAATSWWLNRCSPDDCACLAGDAGRLAGQMGLLKWNSSLGD